MWLNLQSILPITTTKLYKERMTGTMNVYLVLILLVQVLLVLANDGVILFRAAGVRDWNDQPHFCINYNPLFHNLSDRVEKSPHYVLMDLSNKFGCQNSDFTGLSLDDRAVLLARGNCTFSQKARIVQSFGAGALIIRSDELLTPAAENSSVDYNAINITIATILSSSLDGMNFENGSTEVLMYSPQLSGKFDPSMVVMFLIAVSNIAIGGYWAGHTKHAKYQRLKYKKDDKDMDEANSNEDNTGDTSNTDKDDADESVDVTLPALLIFFVLVCGFLVLLYFFYDQLVYVVIGMFCLAGAMGLYYCLYPTWKRLVCFTAKIPRNRIPLLKHRPEYRNILLGLICAGFAIFWGIKRHATYAWVLQDIIGFAFCINIMKTIGVPNLRVCTAMLILLFIYDVFFVFVTPLLTSKGDSVMVKVATGSGSKTHEQLPMVFKVPKLTSDVINVCPLPFSLLGYGDVIIPGLLVSHNHAFDLFIGSKKVYYLCTVLAYGVGLIITFVALTIMETGQPALLYLVPCTLITTFLIGCVRGEVRYLWAGMNQSEKEEESRSETTDVPENRSVETINSNTSGSSAENENGTLLRK